MSAARTQKRPPYLVRRRWTPKDAKQALADLEKSGLSARAFAEQYGLSAVRLLRWRRRLAADTSPLVAFKEIRETRTDANPNEPSKSFDLSAIGITFPSGRTVRFPEGFTVEMLARLLYILGKVHEC